MAVMNRLVLIHGEFVQILPFHLYLQELVHFQNGLLKIVPGLYEKLEEYALLQNIPKDLLANELLEFLYKAEHSNYNYNYYYSFQFPPFLINFLSYVLNLLFILTICSFVAVVLCFLRYTEYL